MGPKGKRKQNACETPSKKKVKSSEAGSPATPGQSPVLDGACLYQAAELNVEYAARLERAKKTLLDHEVFQDMLEVLR